MSRWRFWACAYTSLILLTGTNLPTPLYRGYQERFGFSPLTVTLIFATYVLVLVPSLLMVGPLSDAVGRRRVLLPAVGVAALGSLVFAAAEGTGWLFAARLLQGLAVGAASGALTAALTELEPRGDRRRAALVSTVVSVGGLGLGPLLAGVLAQYAPAPRVLPFMVELVLLVPAALAMASLPATGTGPARWRPRRPQLPAAVRPASAYRWSAWGCSPPKSACSRRCGTSPVPSPRCAWWSSPYWPPNATAPGEPDAGAAGCCPPRSAGSGTRDNPVSAPATP